MKNTNFLPLISQKWIQYWSLKDSMIIQDYTQIVKNIDKIENLKNLFISINGYRIGSKKRKSENISSINCFFYDIDMKDNSHTSKEEIQQKILLHKEKFDFGIETKNGFHLYQMIENHKYDVKDQESTNRYLSDWKIKMKNLEYDLDVNMDHNCIKLTQISRIPGTIHKKEDSSSYTIKLLFGENLLDGKDTIELINNIPIGEVLEKLGYTYDEKDNSLFIDREKTSGWKINTKENYVNDFSHDRIKGGPFAFVLQHYNTLNGIDEKNYGLTYNFFASHFGIIGKSKRSKCISINKGVALSLYNSGLSQKSIQYFLFLSLFFAHKGYKNGEYSDWIDLDEILQFIGNPKLKKSTLKDHLLELQKQSKIKIKRKVKTVDGYYLKEIKMIDIQIRKKEKLECRFSILPNYKSLYYQVKEFQFYYYFSKGILKLSTNNTLLIYLYLYIHKNLLINKNDKIFMSNKELDEFLINKNLSLRNKKLKEFCEIIGEFIIEKDGNIGFWFIKRLG